MSSEDPDNWLGRKLKGGLEQHVHEDPHGDGQE